MDQEGPQEVVGEVSGNNRSESSEMSETDFRKHTTLTIQLNGHLLKQLSKIFKYKTLENHFKCKLFIET